MSLASFQERSVAAASTGRLTGSRPGWGPWQSDNAARHDHAPDERADLAQCSALLLPGPLASYLVMRVVALTSHMAW